MVICQSFRLKTKPKSENTGFDEVKKRLKSGTRERRRKLGSSRSSQSDSNGFGFNFQIHGKIREVRTYARITLTRRVNKPGTIRIPYLMCHVQNFKIHNFEIVLPKNIKTYRIMSLKKSVLCFDF